MTNPPDADSSNPPRLRSARLRKSRTLWTVIGIFLLTLVAGVALWWWKSDSAKPAESSANVGRFGRGGMEQPVSVQAVRLQDIHVTVNAIGNINAANTAIVHVQVSGVLQQLHFKEGQQVQAGQLLAQIDPRAFQASLSQAEGVLARDKAQLDNARIDRARYKDLLGKDAIPKQQLDTQEALVRQLEGTVKSDQGTVDSARLQLSYTRVTAPIAGRVGLKQADLGNVVQPADPNGIVIITQTRPIALVFALPAANVPLITARLRANEAVPVEAWDRSGKIKLATGQVATVDNAIDVTTDTIKVKALFANLDDALFPNQAVSVILQLNILKNVIAVPQAAVLRGAQGFYVYAVSADNSVTARVVKPGPVDSGWMAVEGELKVGEKVVIDGTDRLRDGARVAVISNDTQLHADKAKSANSEARKTGNSQAPAANTSKSAAAHSAAALAKNTDDSSDKVAHELNEKLKNMSEEERRAWLQQHADTAAKAKNSAN